MRLKKQQEVAVGTGILVGLQEVTGVVLVVLAEEPDIQQLGVETEEENLALIHRRDILIKQVNYYE